MRTKYKQYQDMEDMSLKECHVRPFENHNDRFPNMEYDPPFMADPDDPESARITGSQAKRLVHKYIDRIKVDRFTRLTPVWQTTFIQGTVQDNLFAGKKRKLVQLFPFNLKPVLLKGWVHPVELATRLNVTCLTRLHSQLLSWARSDLARKRLFKAHLWSFVRCCTTIRSWTEDSR